MLQWLPGKPAVLWGIQFVWDSLKTAEQVDQLLKPYKMSGFQNMRLGSVHYELHVGQRRVFHTQ